MGDVIVSPPAVRHLTVQPPAVRRVTITSGGTPGAPGPAGADGRSAFEVAQDNGFSGTEPEWLASLQGEDGNDGAPGSPGAAGAAGAPGADGDDAYEIAVDEGFVGTREQWLLSLKGEPGEDGSDGTNGSDGAPGAPGSDGAPGADGEDGADAYEVAVAEGFVGDRAAWLASLVGPVGNDGAPGAAGADGDSAYDVAVANGFVGDEAAWLASLVGPQGEPGEDGAGATPPGSDRQIVFNDAGSFGASAKWRYVETDDVPAIEFGLSGDEFETGGFRAKSGADALAQLTLDASQDDEFAYGTFFFSAPGQTPIVCYFGVDSGGPIFNFAGGDVLRTNNFAIAAGAGIGVDNSNPLAPSIANTGVHSLVAGTNVTIDATDPQNPIVSASGGGGSGIVESVVAGTGIAVDSTDPANPIVSLDVNTDGVPEGSTNEYFTVARAKSAAVADAINNGTTDVAPSQNAVFDALALKAATTYVDAAVAAVSSIGKHAVYIAAGSITPSASGGCAALATEAGASGQPDVSYLAFDSTTPEYAQFAITMPSSWNEGTLTFKPVWKHPATTTNFGVVFDLQAVAFSDDDALATNFGTAQTSTDTGGTTKDLYVGPESAAITVDGSPAAGDTVCFRLSRVTGNGSDTMAVDAHLIGIVLFMTTDGATDS